MYMPPKTPLSQLYPNLHKSSEVQKSAKKSAEYQTLSKAEQAKLLTKNNPEKTKERTELYFNRFAALFDRSQSHETDPRKERNVELLKRMAHYRYVIKPAEIPNRVYELDQQIALERGHGHLEITEEYKEQKNEQIIQDQERSLDRWVDYLTGPDAFYDNWFKYYVFESVTKMGKLDKKTWTYKQRKLGDGTASPFPDLNAEALSIVQGLLKNKFEEKGEEALVNFAQEDPETIQKLQKLVQSGQFRKLYPLVQKKLAETGETNRENRETIEGSWTKYRQDTDDYETLAQSLQSYNTGWCTAGEDMARSQISGGDFYVFYSKDKDGHDKVPRIAIRMEGDEIGEIRGIDGDQELEPELYDTMEAELYDTMEEKAQTLGGYDYYQQKVADMRQLTEIYKKNNHEALSEAELRFVYEVDKNIESFSQQDKDPRIGEILRSRDTQTDLAFILELPPEQIATKPEELIPETTFFYGKSWERRDYEEAYNNPDLTLNMYRILEKHRIRKLENSTLRNLVSRDFVDSAILEKIVTEINFQTRTNNADKLALIPLLRDIYNHECFSEEVRSQIAKNADDVVCWDFQTKQEVSLLDILKTRDSLDDVAVLYGYDAGKTEWIGISTAEANKIFVETIEPYLDNKQEINLDSFEEVEGDEEYFTEEESGEEEDEEETVRKKGELFLQEDFSTAFLAKLSDTAVAKIVSTYPGLIKNSLRFTQLGSQAIKEISDVWVRRGGHRYLEQYARNERRTIGGEENQQIYDLLLDNPYITREYLLQTSAAHISSDPQSDSSSMGYEDTQEERVSPKKKRGERRRVVYDEQESNSDE